MPDGPIAIDHPDDPRIDVHRDVRDKDLRGRDKLFMAESELVLRRLLRTPERIQSMLLSPGKYERLHEDLRPAMDRFPVYVAPLDLMCEIAGFHIHRGALAAGHRPRPAETTIDAALGHLRGKAELTLLIAEGFTNVDNMGGLFRNAAAFSVDGIVLDPACCDPLYRKAIRVSAGHTLSIPWAVAADWPGDLDRLKLQWGCTLIGAEAIDTAEPLWRLPDDERVAFMFGTESTGLTAEAMARCDHVMAIPMREGVPSLNVATASAVMLYERRRGRA